MDLRDCRRLFGHVMDRLLAAGWLESVGFSRHHGFDLAWTPHGAQRASILKDLVMRYGLDEFDLAPELFTRACRGDLHSAAAGRVVIDEATRRFWLQCLEELPLQEQSDDLLGLVHVVLGWQPEIQPRGDWLTV